MNSHTNFAPKRDFYEQAYHQIIVDGGIIFPQDAKKIRALLLRELPHGDIDKTIESLMKIMHMQDFTWSLYQRCVQLCIEHEIYPDAFVYLTNRPHSPKTLSEALSLLTVTEIKSVLKLHEQPITGKREELVQRAQESLCLDDLKNEYTEKLAQQQEKFSQIALKEKYYALVGMVDLRAHFLMRLEQLQELLNSELLKHKLMPIEADPDDAKLAELLDGSGYINAVTENTIHKLLPIFPGGEMQIFTQRLPRNAVSAHRPRQSWWKKLFRLWK